MFKDWSSSSSELGAVMYINFNHIIDFIHIGLLELETNHGLYNLDWNSENFYSIF